MKIIDETKCLVPATGFQNACDSGYIAFVERLEVNEGALSGGFIVSLGLVKGEVWISLGLYTEEAVMFRQEAGSFFNII